jgi:butyrate kinase
MFHIEGVLRKQLRDSMTSKQTLIFPEGEDPRVISAASKLIKFANIILAGRREVVEQMVDGGKAELDSSKKRFFTMVRFVDPRTGPLKEAFANKLFDLSRGKKWEVTLERAKEMIEDPVYFSIMAVRQGYADATLGGLTHSSRDFFTPCLRLLEKDGTVYEMALFALPEEHPAGLYSHNIVMFADVALTPIPTPESLADIAIGACRTMRNLIPTSVLPEINGALLSYSTRGSGEGPSVERIRSAEPLIKERLEALTKTNPLYGTINIIAEMQVSAAVSENAARTKLKDEYEHLKGAGRANVLVVPNLDVGNLLYHIYATRYPNAESVLIIGGMKNQALDFSRSSTADDVSRGTKALLLRRYKSDRYARTPNDYFFPRYRILTVNPGSTSTKVALFEGEDEVARKDISHTEEELNVEKSIQDQLPMRRRVVEEFLEENLKKDDELHAVVGRGGLVLPIESGTYRICDRMADDLKKGESGEHPANLGGLIAREIAAAYGIPAYTVDPPVVDEIDETSRITGLESSEQEAAWHALSQKAAAKHFAELRNQEYEDLNLIVAHLGGGISVGSHRKGRCVKVKNALFDGPMTPNRAGTLPGKDLVEICYSGVSKEDLTRTLTKNSGLLSYLGTDDLREVEKRIEAGDRRAAVVFEAMAEQIASEIASHVPKFKGEPVRRIILTGGMCRSTMLVEKLKSFLQPLAIKISVLPGDRESEALRDGALRVLRGMEEAKEYRPLRDRL